MRNMRAFTYLAVATAFSVPSQAFQLQFEDDHWASSLDTTITYGGMWRLNGQDHRLLKDWNQDDSNRNFDEGMVSNSIRFISEFELSYTLDGGDSFGLFTRATGYYDDKLANSGTDYSTHVVTGSKVTANDAIARDQLWDSMNSSTTYDGSTKPGDFNDNTQDRTGRGAEFLDFFVYAQLFSDTDHPVSLRVGKQVISWGESAFIQNGISSVMNGADVNKAVQPGVEVKEILRPLGAIYGTVQITDNVTFQAYYQYEWDHIITPAYGAYLNPMPDFLNTDGAENLLVQTDVLADFVYLRGLGLSQDEQLLTNNQISVERLADEDASDDGQWGLAVNWLVPEFNDTEFGFYLMNYHRKLPDLVVRNYGGRGLSQSYGGVSHLEPEFPEQGWTYSDYLGNFTGGTYGEDCAASANSANCSVLAIVSDAADVSSFNVKYFEDVKLYGFSWATVLPVTDTAFSGEIALHHNIPVQTLHAFQGLLEDAMIGCHPLFSTTPGPCEFDLSTREDVVVTQLFFFHDFNNFTFADDVNLFLEIGWIHAVDLDDGELNTPFVYDDGSGIDGGDDTGAITAGYVEPGRSVVPSAPAGANNPNGGSAVSFPFNGMSSQIPDGSPAGYDNRGTAFIGNSPASKDSYGYQFIFSTTWYNGVGRHIDALTGTDLIASFAFRHDFKGTSVIPGTGFTEGTKAATLSLDATWQNTWTVNLSYTNFFGHSTDTLGLHSSKHPLDDKDFVALAVAYRF